jgi:outer membrane protein OmpA-like peptidoglycan-associated protein
MSRRPDAVRLRVLLTIVLCISAAFAITGKALAQDETPPKYELFTGYQWINPGGTVPAPFQPPNAPVPFKLPSLADGVGVSLNYNFTPVFGFEGDVGHNWNDTVRESTGSIGPRVTWRTEGVNMFVHTLFGYNRLQVKSLVPSNAVGAILGGGMDIKFSKLISVRLFEADYVWAAHHFADSAGPNYPDLRRPQLDGVRLRTGIVWNFGGAPPVPVAASCSVQPSDVMVGEPVTATATGTNFNPKHTLTYTWNSTGGKVTGKDNTASIDTNGVAGGSYTVTAHITDPKTKSNGEASCTANFTVKEPPKNPPTMSCSASPTSVQAGTPVTVTCNCTSPDNVPVTVSGWTATAGSVSGSGNTATLTTTGASPGPITVTATCSDPRGLSTSASTEATVEAPPPPPPPQASKLSECDFPNKVKPWRVDNTCKAILDDVAQRLQHEPDSKLVIVGNADPMEKRKNLAAERAVNSKAYLSGGEAKQGIDPSRIETRTGNAGTKTAEYWVVPAGATYSGAGTEAVDEGKVKPVPDHPHAPARKGKAKPKAQ